MAEANTRAIVGAVIAALFLALYGYVLLWAILCAQKLTGAPGQDAFYIMNVVGGLVSAVVVAELAITAAGSAPTGGTFLAAPAGSGATGPRLLATVYVFAWLALGIAALVFGLMNRRADVPELMAFAKTWLGLAIAAAYAYFGIKP